VVRSLIVRSFRRDFESLRLDSIVDLALSLEQDPDQDLGAGDGNPAQ
jgi:hypothetical protein